jgi:general secretion pathway protein E
MNSNLMDLGEADEAASTDVADLLIEWGKLDPSALERALRLQQETGERVDRLLTKLGQVSDRDMAAALSEKLELPLATPGDYPVEPVLENKLSAKFLKEFRVLPLSDAPDRLRLAMADPLDTYALEAVRLAASKPVSVSVGIPAEIEGAFARLYGNDTSGVGGPADDLDISGDDATQRDVERLRDLASEAPVIRLVNTIIGRAVDMKASDIHIEPFEHKLEVRYRIDGILREQESPPLRLRAAIVSRVKLMAKLNIAETRLPQDGRIKLAIRGKEIDMRVSTVPTLYGESIALRVLDRTATVLDFEALGFDPKGLRLYLSVLERSHGILLVTGPTGSGKTTTLYASLQHLNTGDRKILTAEDPIEYQLDGVNQVQVKPQIGLNFASALRSFLRQDPDVIMVGEIRDKETAQIAVQAALTGHIVLSTLHTNNASSTITRMIDMGVDDYLISSTVNGVLAQRLVRVLCKHCREVYAASPEIIADLNLGRYTNSKNIKDIELYKAKGCQQCGETGYSGRTTILEILTMSEPVRRLVTRGSDASEIQRVAIDEGMRTMFADGVQKVMVGTTSLEEVMRVTRET